jgi:hypothetical protein
MVIGCRSFKLVQYDITAIHGITPISSTRTTVVGSNYDQIILFGLVYRSQYAVRYIYLDSCTNGKSAVGTPLSHYFY